jgi:predicted DNA-binding transcriptional regulator YafY
VLIRSGVTATVQDTVQLDWWLLGFGSAVLVLEPPALAVRVAEATQSMAAVKPEKSLEP